MAGDRRLFVVAQKRAQDDDPDFAALYPVGVTADIIQRVELPNGNWRVKVSCSSRAAIVRPHADGFLAAEIEPIEETRGADPEAFERMREVPDAYPSYTSTAVPPYLYGYSQEPGVLADLIAQQLKGDMEQKQGRWRFAMSSRGSTPFLPGSRRARLRREGYFGLRSRLSLAQ